jgi:hypothetical protein
MAFDCLYAGGKDLRKPRYGCAGTSLRPSRPLAHVGRVDYDSRVMLSRAQEARVREILQGHVPGTLPAYCLEHLGAAAQIPQAHLADLAAFVRNLRACGACQTQFGGVCDSGDHATPRLLISARRIPPPQEARRVS